MKSNTPVYLIAIAWVMAGVLVSGPSDARAQQATGQAPAPGPAPAAAVPLRPPHKRPRAADRKDMMEQLGIKALRPGPSGNEQAPESRELRRGDGESLPETAGSADVEERHRRSRPPADVVEAAASGDRRGLRARSARPRSEERAEGHVDCDRHVEGMVGGHPRHRQAARRTRRQLCLSGDQRRHPDDAGHAG